MVDDWLEIAQAWVLPWTCLCCGAAGDPPRDLCRACRDALPWIASACPRCALPLPPGAPRGARCGRCLRRPRSPVAGAVAPFRYAHPVDRLLIALKFGARLEVARLLGGLLAGTVAARGVRLPELVVPVPLHPARLAARGFNQATELARPLAGGLGLPLATDLCVRLRDTPAQRTLDARARRRNLRDAFAVRGCAPRRVALVDDVVTTGSTCAALARALLAAGAREVQVWSVARTP